MTPTEDARVNLERIKPRKGESTQSLARRMYDLQMEIYSAWAMTDLWVPLESQPEKVQRQWMDSAREKIKAKGKR